MPLTNQETAHLQGSSGQLRVGFTEQHGMAVELSKYPPPGVKYSFVKPLPLSNKFIRSPIKGYLGHYESKEHDLIEAILSPVFTTNRWIYYAENFQAATAFNFLGWPLPKKIRIDYLNNLLLKDNFKKLIFWSEAGVNTLRTYGGIQCGGIMEKSTVVYPAVREVVDGLIQFSNKDDVHILFSGDFFRKGGVNVIGAFERAQRIYPAIKLILCCDEKIDFNTRNAFLKAEYLEKINNNKGIVSYGRIPRDVLINTILPKTDIYLLPTYAEAFGYSILEAMAFGIPVIATNQFAISEMIEHNKSGFLIDTSQYPCDKFFKGYVVDKIPDNFRHHVTDNLFNYLCQLIESSELREKFGRAGLAIARTKFSFNERNIRMFQIYQEALAI